MNISAKEFEGLIALRHAVQHASRNAETDIPVYGLVLQQTQWLEEEWQLRMKEKQKRTEVDWHGMTASGVVVSGDWEGDPSVPGGIRHIPTYVEDVYVSAPDSFELWEEFTDAAIEDISQEILDAWIEEQEKP